MALQGQEQNKLSGFPSIDYTVWFTDKFVSNCFGPFPQKYEKAADSEKQEIFADAKTAAVVYSLLVYYIYKIKPDFRKAVDSSKELSSNYKAIKAWLDGVGGRKIADFHVNELRQIVS